jgi:hypothetical protein
MPRPSQREAKHMDRAFEVCTGGCVLPLVLLTALAAPILMLNEYRRTRNY